MRATAGSFASLGLVQVPSEHAGGEREGEQSEPEAFGSGAHDSDDHARGGCGERGLKDNSRICRRVSPPPRLVLHGHTITPRHRAYQRLRDQRHLVHGLLLIRKDRRATLTIRESNGGSVVAVRGKLDTGAASRLQHLAIASGRDLLPM